jgi:hypothetical protein
MSTKFNINYDGTVPYTVDSVRFNLTSAGGAQSHTIPGDSTKRYQARFYYEDNSNVFVGFEGVTATIPGSGSKESTDRIEFRPDKRYVRGGDSLSLITPDTSVYVGVTFLEIPS